MKYTYNRLLPDVPIDEADSRTREALKEQGFGVLTEIDVKETMKKKIGAEMDGYRILGACNPNMAYKAIGMKVDHADRSIALSDDKLTKYGELIEGLTDESRLSLRQFAGIVGRLYYATFWCFYKK